MPNTLRRKMFKLGGVANTHGVGITSGLKMKKGGKVDPQATFGVGNNALRKIGPDGKEREAHVAFLPYLGAGALALGRAGLSALRSPTSTFCCSSHISQTLGVFLSISSKSVTPT